jgi:hypothetical protein
MEGGTEGEKGGGSEATSHQARAAEAGEGGGGGPLGGMIVSDLLHQAEAVRSGDNPSRSRGVVDNHGRR